MGLFKSLRPVPFLPLLLGLALADAVMAQITPGTGTPRRHARIDLPADQPFASYWFPEDLLTWSPETDPDAPYNRSHTPLVERFLAGGAQANPHARPGEARIAPLSIFWSTSGNPSQGSLQIDHYAFNYWQYTEVLVFWGGSAGEGLILAPNPGVIDAAHRNGVPVLGTIFFPPNVYGGNIQWVWDLVQRDGDTFPVAAKLIEAAEYYGFDGYFINQETSGGNAILASELIACMKYFQQNSDLQLMWYDAMTESGSIFWQEQLNASNDGFFHDVDGVVSEHMFLDFGWSTTDLQISRLNAQALGRSEYDLYAGIDVQASGHDTFVSWNSIFPAGLPHVTSLGLYVPSWTYHGAADHLDFYARANRFWVGANRDPSNTATAAAWKGLAHYIPARSIIADLPFVTNFCVGHGFDYHVDGARLSHPGWSLHGWNNLALQDILPTWRWIVESSGAKLYPEMDWSDAYYGGNCLKLSGDLTADNHLKLFLTNLRVSASTRLDIVFKSGAVGPAHLQVGLAFTGDPTAFTYLDVGDSETADWNLRSFDLGSYADATIAVVSLFFPGGAGSDYAMKIGRIGITEGTPTAPAAPAGLYVESRVDEDDFVTLRLRWEHSADSVRHYNVYRRNPDASLTYLGGTPNNAYFVPEIRRVTGDSLVVVEVEAVGPEFIPSSRATTSFLWDAPPQPASDPDPADGAMNVYRNPRLAWTAGRNTDSHDIYFGEASPPPFVTSLGVAEFDPGELTASTAYYWRVDEVNRFGTTPGAEWSFTTGIAFADTSLHALLFDGSDDYLDCGNDASLQITGQEITLEARLSANAWRTNVWEGSILNKEQNGAGSDNGYMLRAGNAGQLNFNLGSGSWHEISSAVGAMEVGRWYHVAGSYDGSVLRLYIDGALIAQSPRALNIANAAGIDLLIGNSQSNPSRVFDGLIDEVRIWNVTRSQDQIQQTLNGELPSAYYTTPDSGLIGYWRLNEGQGQIAGDLSAAANHATLGNSSGSDPHDPQWVASDWIITPVPAGARAELIPGRYALLQNRPNPFNPQTTIRYDLPAESLVSLRIYDLLGRRIRTLIQEVQPAGHQAAVWDGRDDRGRPQGSGLYLYRLRAGDWFEQKKMLLLK